MSGLAYGDDCLWHLVDKLTAPAFVRYWTNSGQTWILASVSASLTFFKPGPWAVWSNYRECTSPHTNSMVRPTFVAAPVRILGRAAGRNALIQSPCTRARLLSCGR
jgi:hypothetical protein